MQEAEPLQKKTNTPETSSESSEETIGALRVLTEKRHQAKKGLVLGHDSQGMEETKEESRLSQKQIEQSEKCMTTLQADGTELVTNVLVASDAQEINRRAELEEARRLRIEKLENEATSSEEKCDDIRHKWTEIKAKDIPQDLRDALNCQQQLCGRIIEDKNKLINELQQELKTSDDRYVKDLKKQAEDVDLMIERMEEQIISLEKAYGQELELIESSFSGERKDLLTENTKKWEHQREKRSEKELELLLLRMKNVEEREAQLQRLRLEDSEEYKTIKKNLESEIEIREQQLQDIKAACQLNQEKLDYNLYVLKKRDEENAITKSQQKRKLTRLQDNRNNLKTKCADFKKQSHMMNQAFISDYKRSMQQFKDTQKKMKHFAAIDAKRFEEIWLMNEAEAKALVHKALEIDQIIHEQLLGLAWSTPQLDFMNNTGPLQLQPSCSARQLAAQVLEKEEEEIEGVTQATILEDRNILDDSGSLDRDMAGLDQKTLKRLLELLCDEMGFLIESRLLKILSPLEKDEQSLMKLDSIFSAIGIEKEEDVYKMADFFAKYRQQHMDEAHDTSLCNQEMLDSNLIHPNDVLKVFRAFTAQYCKSRGESQHQSSNLVLEQRDDSEDAAYWESMANVITEPTLKLWSALEPALEKYHTVLTERSKLLSDTQHLKQQNSELRLLLKQYLNSKVNAELVIPPTQMMSLGPK